MCKKKQFKYCPSEIDDCMKNFIENLNILLINSDLVIFACCCGHFKYPMTIIVKHMISGKVFDLISSKTIPRKRNFYKKDKQGYYFIPETIK